MTQIFDQTDAAGSGQVASRKFFSAYKRPAIADGLLKKMRKRETSPRLLAQGKDQWHNPYILPFRGFSWDVFGDALLASDFSPLNSDQIDAVEKVAAQILSDKRWQTSSTDRDAQAKMFALGLIAGCISERVAERFSRRALKNAPEWVCL